MNQTTWFNVTHIMLSERNQAENGICVIPFTRSSETSRTNHLGYWKSERWVGSGEKGAQRESGWGLVGLCFLVWVLVMQVHTLCEKPSSEHCELLTFQQRILF